MRISIDRSSDHRRKNLGLVAVGLLVAIGLSVPTGAAATAAPAPGRASNPAAQPDERETKLMMRYLVRSTCTVHPNYPKDGVIGNDGHSWTVVPNGRRSVIWRYNVDNTWALISDPSRAKEQFPWWGFTRRECLGASVEQAGFPTGQPVPSRILEGRSQRASGWRRVDFDVAPAPVTGRRRLDSGATLRDPANFVIGNVLPGWTVEVTGRTRSAGHWVEVYVPNARRWGYIEQSNLG